MEQPKLVSPVQSSSLSQLTSVSASESDSPALVPFLLSILFLLSPFASGKDFFVFLSSDESSSSSEVSGVFVSFLSSSLSDSSDLSLSTAFSSASSDFSSASGSSLDSSLDSSSASSLCSSSCSCRGHRDLRGRERYLGYSTRSTSRRERLPRQLQQPLMTSLANSRRL